ncbi:MAG TPA: hypothetical protein VHB02_06105 [Acidimicrobiales bacterium]|nr:hypothetical protein [Acidimicrobiales bacterium]
MATSDDLSAAVTRALEQLAVDAEMPLDLLQERSWIEDYTEDRRAFEVMISDRQASRAAAWAQAFRALP